MKMIVSFIGFLIFISLSFISLYFNVTIKAYTIWNNITLISLILSICFLVWFLKSLLDNCFIDVMSIYKGGGDRIWEDIENDVPYDKSYAKQLHDSFKK